jgi:hypothetical protein
LTATDARYYLFGAEGVDLSGYVGRRVNVTGKPVNGSAGNEKVLEVSSIFPRE